MTRLPHSLDDYRNALSGNGPLKYEWRDKPYRLVYDLVDEVERLRSDIEALSGRIAADYQEKTDLRAAVDYQASRAAAATTSGERSLMTRSGRRWLLVSKDRPERVHVATQQDEPYIEPIPLGTTVEVMPVVEHEAVVDLLVTALQQIATIPKPCRNPDGDEQGIETAWLIAQETLAKHREQPQAPHSGGSR